MASKKQPSRKPAGKPSKKGKPAARQEKPAKAKAKARKPAATSARQRKPLVSVVLPALVRAGTPLELTMTAGAAVQVTDIELHLSTEVIEVQHAAAAMRDHVHHHQAVKGKVTLTPGVAHPLVVELPAYEHLLDGATALETFAGDDCELFRLDGNPEAALAFTTLADRVLTISAKVDGKPVILGRREVQVLPPLAGPLAPVGRLSAEDLSRTLTAIGARFAFAVRGADRWFVWFGDARGNAVGEAELRAVVSIRDESVSRTFTNRNLPAFGMHPAQSGETKYERRGGFAVARAWTEELVAAAPELDGMMPRLVSNTWFGLANVRFAAGEPVVPEVGAEAPGAGALWSRLAVGDRIHVQLGDNDALDDYTFRIDSLDGGLKVHWQMGKSDQGDLFYSTRAIETATTFTVMSQGNVELDGRDEPSSVTWSMPPFMLSRHVIRELKCRPVVVAVSEGDQTLAVAGHGESTIEIEGARITVKTLKLTGDSLDLEVVDDEGLPLVLSRRSWGEEVVTFERFAR